MIEGYSWQKDGFEVEDYQITSLSEDFQTPAGFTFKDCLEVEKKITYKTIPERAIYPIKTISYLKKGIGYVATKIINNDSSESLSYLTYFHNPTFVENSANIIHNFNTSQLEINLTHYDSVLTHTIWIDLNHNGRLDENEIFSNSLEEKTYIDLSSFPFGVYGCEERIESKGSLVSKYYRLDLYDESVHQPNKTDIRLNSLEFNEGVIEPAFSKDIFNYTLTVPYGTEMVTFSTELADSSAELHTNTSDSSWTISDIEELIISVSSISNYHYYTIKPKILPLTETPKINEIVSITINDGISGSGEGNGDRKIQVGEEINFDVEIINNGEATAYDITGKIILNSYDTSHCTVIDDNDSIDSILSGNTEIFDGFDISILSYPNDGDLDFTIDIEYEDEYGNTFKDSVYFSIPVESYPIISMTKNTLNFIGKVNGPNIPSQTITISNAGGGYLTWYYYESSDWFSIRLSDDLNSIIVEVDTTNLEVGYYRTGIQIFAEEEYIDPVNITVNLELLHEDITPISNFTIDTSSGLDNTDYTIGKTIEMRWNPGSESDDIEIILLNDKNEVVKQLESSSINDGRYNYLLDNVNRDLPFNQNLKIRLISKGNGGFIDSNYFQIKKDGAVIVCVDGLSFINTFMGTIDYYDSIMNIYDYAPDERTLYLVDAIDYMIDNQDIDLEVHPPNVYPFFWDGDASDSIPRINELKSLIQTSSIVADQFGHNLVIISHSWGTFLSFTSLVELFNENSQIDVELFITLSSPIGTEFAHDQTKTGFESVQGNHIPHPG